MSEKNQFFYTRVTYGPVETIGEGDDKKEVRKEIKWRDSFNLNKVIRSMEFENETIILLDDGHEVTEEVPQQNKKGGIEYVRKRMWVQSELVLKDKADRERFIQVSETFTPVISPTTTL